MGRRTTAALLVTLVGTLATVLSQPMPAPAMPDPSQTFNLWSYLIASESMNGALALTYTREQDEAGLRSKYETFATRLEAGRPRPVALGHEIHGELALVLMLEGIGRMGKPDIDPVFLIRDGDAWKLLPVFGTPRRGLNGLTDEQNTALLALADDYRRRRAELKKSYAEKLETNGARDGS